MQLIVGDWSVIGGIGSDGATVGGWMESNNNKE